MADLCEDGNEPSGSLKASVTIRDGNDISIFTKYRYFLFDIAIYRYRNFDSIYRIIYRFSHKFIYFFVRCAEFSPIAAVNNSFINEQMDTGNNKGNYYISEYEK
ncbi:hypothetical protein ANN_26511 [Periplaneta americana]|uniref:Uncharacterized protein n=1 Tax=Periplaneta americana TaxID=6978 RepID=A0ABQ8RYF0_PERAM|nr:hypothetical protein ANN_26511 [Periplaneta americana]